MNKWIKYYQNLIWILFGLMFGSIIGKSLAKYSMLDWMEYGYIFGMQEPIVLDLGAVVTSLGIQIDINITGIIGMFIAIIIYNKTEK